MYGPLTMLFCLEFIVYLSLIFYRLLLCRPIMFIFLTWGTQLRIQIAYNTAMTQLGSKIENLGALVTLLGSKVAILKLPRRNFHPSSLPIHSELLIIHETVRRDVA